MTRLTCCSRPGCVRGSSAISDSRSSTFSAHTRASLGREGCVLAGWGVGGGGRKGKTQKERLTEKQTAKTTVAPNHTPAQGCQSGSGVGYLAAHFAAVQGMNTRNTCTAWAAMLTAAALGGVPGCSTELGQGCCSQAPSIPASCTHKNTQADG